MLTRRPSRLIALVAIGCLATAAGCAKRGARASKATPENFVQKLVLDVDGKPVDLPLEKMDVNLVKRGNFPETYEIHGTGVVLVGEFPKGVNVGYGEDWNVLVGKAVPILPTGGSEGQKLESTLTLPGQPAYPVTGGSITVAEIGEDIDAKTPLSGRIEIQCQTPQGEKTFRGTFAVNGTTWG